MERLQKLIAEAGIASRRKAEELIAQGRVRVNGTVVTAAGTKAEKTDRIEVDGKLIHLEQSVYYLLNKPRHVLCTVQDDRNRKTILSCFPDVKERIYPVGRLDYDTTGVLLVSNDGAFANAMMHPRYHLPKTYRCTIDGLFTAEMAQQLETGIELEDGMTLPAKVQIEQAAKKKTVLLITIFEGRNREIRRMMEYFRFHVLSLDRIQYGFLEYGKLKRGEYRTLKKEEVRKLMELSQRETPAAFSSSGSGSM